MNPIISRGPGASPRLDRPSRAPVPFGRVTLGRLRCITAPSNSCRSSWCSASFLSADWRRHSQSSMPGTMPIIKPPRIAPCFALGCVPQGRFSIRRWSRFRPNSVLSLSSRSFILDNPPSRRARLLPAAPPRLSLCSLHCPSARSRAAFRLSRDPQSGLQGRRVGRFF